MIKFIIMWNLVYFNHGGTPIAQYNTRQACLASVQAYEQRINSTLMCFPTSVPIVVPK
jgi:hypothetical protein